jgi:hypothetical protein
VSAKAVQVTGQQQRAATGTRCISLRDFTG